MKLSVSAVAEEGQGRAPAAVPPSRFRSALKDGWIARMGRDFVRNKVATVCLIIFVLVIFIALTAPFISPQNPYDLMQLDIGDSLLPPMSRSNSSEFLYLLGTDDQGRDMLSGIIYGLRVSLLVSFTCTAIAFCIGSVLGITAAYCGGIVESLIMRIADIQLSFPSILIALVFISTFGKGVDKIIVALVLVQWAVYARTARGTALVELRKEYVEAAHCLRLSSVRIIFRYILPNCLPSLFIVATVQLATTISTEATLSFLGLGLPITEPSLGLLIANGYNFLLSGSYWISVFPGVALLLLMLCLNVIADQLRLILNPRLKT